MSALVTRLTDLATRVATECKSIRTLVNGNAADLSALTTTSKTSLVSALNELKTGLDSIPDAASINDGSTTSTTETYSVAKIRDYVTTALSAITTGAPGALDTLAELSDALGDDANFATTITTALGNRVRTDTAEQGLTSQQKTNARTNIDAVGNSAIGDPDTNLVAVFDSGLT